MPRYHVYNTRTGDVVHTHEHIDAVSGESLPCAREEVFALFGDEEGDQWDVIEEGGESVGPLRVDTKTKTLALQSKESADLPSGA